MNYNKSLPDYILLLIKKRKFFRKKAKQNDQESRKTYNFLTKVVRKEIDALVNTNWNSFIAKQGKNPISSKPFWQKINKFRGNTNSNSTPTLKNNNKDYEEDKDKANIFAELLKITFSDENDEKFDAKFKDRVEKVVDQHDYTRHNYTNRDCFKLKDLNQIIRTLKLHSAPGQDCVHNQMLKNSTPDFQRILLSLINLTVKQSKLPNDWKSSIITMIPKKKSNSTDPKDYRPISLTSNLAKLTEKLMSIKLKEFLKKNNIIIKQQSGFRANRQTKDNICLITQKIIEQFNRGKKVCRIFFDIASAFDKVWHKGIIYKLIKLKTPSFIVSWLRDFLDNRFFYVKIKN
jgi:hypothetical protein